MTRARGNRLSTATRPLGPRLSQAFGSQAFGARGTRKMVVPPQYVGVAPAAPTATKLSLEDFAAMRAALVQIASERGVVSEAERAAVFAKYGLDSASEKAESAGWNARFKEDRFLFADYMQAFARLRAEGDAEATLDRRLSAARAEEQERQQKARSSSYSG